MTVLERILDVLPPPYTVAGDGVISAVLDDVALELDLVQEDLDRMRRSHWVAFAYRFADLRRIADLAGVDAIPGETLESFRERLLAVVAARLHGAVGPAEIRGFVHLYLRGVERALRSTFVPGLSRYDADGAFADDPDHRRYRPLALVENPPRERRSPTLQAMGGRVPYLFRWEEDNCGLGESVARLAITGLPGGSTAVPLLVNMTTGDLIGYAGVLRVGQRLELLPADDEFGTRRAVGVLDGHDVSERLFSVSGFELGVAFESDARDPQPLLPRLAGRTNAWTYLSAGLYDVRGLDHVFYAIADEQLREGVFDETSYDHAVLRSGAVACVELAWIELEPASFEVRVPRYLAIVAPEVAAAKDGPAHELIATALRSTIAEIHAAGVHAQVVFEPFRETQRQRVRAPLPWVVIEPQKAPVGEGERLSLGGAFGDTAFDTSRFQ